MSVNYRLQGNEISFVQMRLNISVFIAMTQKAILIRFDHQQPWNTLKKTMEPKGLPLCTVAKNSAVVEAELPFGCRRHLLLSENGLYYWQPPIWIPGRSDSPKLWWKNVDSPRRVPSHRVAKASTFWMTKDYKTCIDLVDSITEVPRIILSIFLVMHNNLVWQYTHTLIKKMLIHQGEFLVIGLQMQVLWMTKVLFFFFNGTQLAMSVREFTLLLSTIFPCKYTKVMWLCKSKGFHNSFLRVVPVQFHPMCIVCFDDATHERCSSYFVNLL